MSKNRNYFPTFELLQELTRRKDTMGFYWYTPAVDLLLTPQGKDRLYHIGQNVLHNVDYVIPRIGRQQTEHALMILHFLEKHDIPASLNSRALLLSRNKFLTYLTLSKHGIPFPKTALITTSFFPERILKSFTFPIVLKLMDSFGGMGTSLIHDVQQLKETLQLLATLNVHKVMIQEYLVSSSFKSMDYRFFVVGDEVVAAMKRESRQKTEWRANYSLGAKVSCYKPKEWEIELALKISKIIGIKIAGIDFLPTREKLYTLEINACPGWKGLQEACDSTKIAKKIIDFVVSELKK